MKQSLPHVYHDAFEGLLSTQKELVGANGVSVCQGGFLMEARRCRASCMMCIAEQDSHIV